METRRSAFPRHAAVPREFALFLAQRYKRRFVNTDDAKLKQWCDGIYLLQRMIGEELQCFNETFSPPSPDDRQFDRRTFVRTAFGCIEAQLSCLMAAAFAFPGDNVSRFGEEDTLALCHQRRGKEGVVDDRAPIAKRLKLVARCTAKLVNPSFRLDVNSSGWNIFQSAVRIRDRIVHPHVAADWELTFEDHIEVLKAYMWFREQLLALLATVPPSPQC